MKSGGYIKTVVTLWTTPKELHRMANEMELRAKQLKVGEIATTSRVFLDKTTVLEIGINQDYLNPDGTFNA